MPKRSHKALLLSEKVKILDVVRKEKNSYAEFAESILRMNFLPGNDE
jgi:hypothetical protein